PDGVGRAGGRRRAPPRPTLAAGLGPVVDVGPGEGGSTVSDGVERGTSERPSERLGTVSDGAEPVSEGAERGTSERLSEPRMGTSERPSERLGTVSERLSEPRMGTSELDEMTPFRVSDPLPTGTTLLEAS